jgi:hypothetical protein
VRPVDRRLPKDWAERKEVSYAVFFDSERLGLLREPQLVELLLRSDRQAEVWNGRQYHRYHRCWIILSDLDAWLTLGRAMRLGRKKYWRQRGLTYELLPSSITPRGLVLWRLDPAKDPEVGEGRYLQRNYFNQERNRGRKSHPARKDRAPLSMPDGTQRSGSLSGPARPPEQRPTSAVTR